MQVKITNISWPEERFEKASKALQVFCKLLPSYIYMPIVIIHCTTGSNKKDRAQEDNGIILLFEHSPDVISDFCHELGHLLFRYSKLTETEKYKFKKILSRMQPSNSARIIFDSSYLSKNEDEALAELLKWYILGDTLGKIYWSFVQFEDKDAADFIEQAMHDRFFREED